MLSLPQIRTRHSRLHRLRAKDGWPLALYEYDPAPAPAARGDFPSPVLLVHGGMSRYTIYDLGEGTGLAPWLSRRGAKVFSLDLRGRGESLPRKPGTRAWALLRKGWTLDDFPSFDIPAAAEFILSRTGAKSFDYVGHSMGGIIAYLYLTRTKNAPVRRVVTIASPGLQGLLERRHHERRKKPGYDPFVFMNPAFQNIPMIPIAELGRLASLLPEKILGTAFYPGNTPPETARRYLRYGMASVSSRKFAGFQKIAFPKDPEAQRSQMMDYRHPTLFLAGSRDTLTPADLVARTAALPLHPENRYRCFGPETGSKAHYNHADLLLGRYAPYEVFPEIARWLGEPAGE